MFKVYLLYYESRIVDGPEGGRRNSLQQIRMKIIEIIKEPPCVLIRISFLSAK